MSNKRTAAKIDANQPQIVKDLRKMGATVQVGVDDIFVGYRGRNYWYEIKTPETVSPRTGQIRPSSITASEKKRFETWKGHYRYVASLEQILEDMGITVKEK